MPEFSLSENAPGSLLKRLSDQFNAKIYPLDYAKTQKYYSQPFLPLSSAKSIGGNTPLQHLLAGLLGAGRADRRLNVLFFFRRWNDRG